MFLVPPPPPHANACTSHNFVTTTPIKFIFAIAIEVPDYDFWHQSDKQNGLCMVAILYKNAQKACGVSNLIVASHIWHSH